MKSIIKISVPSKIHLLGEHAVVYGKPAIIISVGLFCEFILTKRTDSKIVISSNKINHHINTSVKAVLVKVNESRKIWQEFDKTKNISVLESIIKSPEDYILCCIGETLLYRKKNLNQSGFNLKIDSEIPVGAGLGSSASIGAGIAGAINVYLGYDIDKNIINDITYNCEKLRHGNPSGSDSAAVIHGGLVWFRKELPDFRIIQPLPFKLPENISEKFLLIDTGIPKESTGVMVSSVRSLYDNMFSYFILHNS